MTTSIILKTRVRFNGREYTSVEEMPAEVRQAYERAVANLGESGRGITSLPNAAPAQDAAATSGLKVVFNGHAYGSIEEMPADVRQLYESIRAAVGATASGMASVSQSGETTASPPLTPAALSVSPMMGGVLRSESTSARLVVAIGAVALVLLGMLVFGR